MLLKVNKSCREQTKPCRGKTYCIAAQTTILKAIFDQLTLLLMQNFRNVASYNGNGQTAIWRLKADRNVLTYEHARKSAQCIGSFVVVDIG